MTPIMDSLARAHSPKNRRKHDESGAQRSDSSSEMVFYTGAHSYNHGSGVWDLFKQTMYFGRSMLARAACTQAHAPLWHEL